MSLAPEKRQTLDAIINEKGYTDYKWIDPKKIIVAQRVRMKCKFEFPINVRTDYDQKMDRYAFLMVH